jgi:REP element-mobilizing transposase RayT
MTGPPIFLDRAKAEVLLGQFRETAAFRGWGLRAAAIMFNHFHLVVQVPDDPDPRKVLADFKAYGTRALNRAYGKPPSETWWTGNGSKRILRGPDALAAAVRYVRDRQPNPLVVWSPDKDPGEPGASATGAESTSGH